VARWMDRLAAWSSSNRPLVPGRQRGRQDDRLRTMDHLHAIWRSRGRYGSLAQVSGSFRVIWILVSAGAVAGLLCCTDVGVFEIYRAWQTSPGEYGSSWYGTTRCLG